MHQLAQYERRPAARNGGESDLDRAGGLWAAGAPALVRHQRVVPVVVGFRLVSHGVAGFAGAMNIEPNIVRDHAPTVSLTTVPEQHPAVFAEAFNTGSADAVAQVYEPGAVFVPQPGSQVAGEALAKATADFLGLGLPINVLPRHTYVADDIALLIVDWVIDGPGPGGEHVHIEGTATDVARRGADGLWRYIIDNPFGTARPS
jgi:ketosteroid isomerase-like protein